MVQVRGRTVERESSERRLFGVLILTERGPLMGNRQAWCLAGHMRLVVYRANAADINPAINHV